MRAAGQGLEFVGWIVLARRLGAAGFGTLSVAFLVSRYAGLIADWGASMRGSRDVAAGSPGLHALARHRLLVSIALTMVYGVGVTLAGHGVQAPLGLAILARGIGRDWVALGKGRGLRSGVPALLQGMLLTGTTLTVVHDDRAAALIVGGAYIAAGILSLALNPLPPSSPASAATGARKPQAWMLLMVFMDQITATMDTFLLAVLRSTSAAGVYSAVYRIPNAWITVLGLMIAGFVPVATRTLADDPRQLVATMKRLRRTAALSGLALALVAPLSFLVVPLMFGHAYDGGRLPLAILVVATAITTAATPMQPLHLALGRDRELAVAYAVSGVASLAFDVLFIPFLGAVGGAIATLLTQICIAAFLHLPLPRIMRELSA